MRPTEYIAFGKPYHSKSDEYTSLTSRKEERKRGMERREGRGTEKSQERKHANGQFRRALKMNGKDERKGHPSTEIVAFNRLYKVIQRIFPEISRFVCFVDFLNFLPSGRSLVSKFGFYKKFPPQNRLEIS